MKKIVISTLAIAAALSMAACGKKDEAKAPAPDAGMETATPMATGSADTGGSMNAAPSSGAMSPSSSGAMAPSGSAPSGSAMSPSSAGGSPSTVGQPPANSQVPGAPVAPGTPVDPDGGAVQNLPRSN